MFLLPLNRPRFTPIVLMLMVFYQALQASPDSLRQQWLDSSLPDDQRLTAANEWVSEKLETSSPDSALQGAKEYYELALAGNQAAHQAQALMLEGRALIADMRPDEALEPYTQSLAIWEQLGDQERISEVYIYMGELYAAQRLLLKSLEYYQKGLKIEEDLGLVENSSSTLNNIANLFVRVGDFEQAQAYYERVIAIKREMPGEERNLIRTLANLSGLKSQLGKYEEAIALSQEVMARSEKIDFAMGKIMSLHIMGMIYKNQDKYEEALSYYQQELVIQEELGGNTFGIQISLGNLYRQLGEVEKSLEICREAEQKAIASGNQVSMRFACSCLYEGYKLQGEWEKAVGYYEKMKVINDSLNKQSYDREINQRVYQFEYEKQKEIDELTFQAELQSRNMWMMVLGVGLLGFLATAYFQYRARKEKEHLLREIQDKNKTILETQDQLIVQEKMASLGQLSLGIAHEIKNPLNFVTNYAEVSVDLANELEEEFTRLQSAIAEDERKLIQEIIGDLCENATVIRKNGQRADTIVSSMRNHATDNQGQRAEVNLNQLVKERTELAYFGYKSQEAFTPVELVFELASDLPAISLIPQDIGRVILNLVSNALEAMHEKAQQADASYTPSLQIRTQQKEQSLEIHIRDNGNGISLEHRDKVFQPFFTTKPTGQGNTGLGLSISYDIVVQGHQGTLTVESEEGKFAEFVVSLPLA